MTNQIDGLMSLAREWVQARTKDHGGSPQQDALRQALDTALNNWKQLSMTEITAENHSAMEYCKHWEDRALKAEAALKQSAPVAWRLWDDEPGGVPAWRYYDQSDFRNDVNPQDFFHSLVPLYTTTPAQTPMQKINIPPGMVDPLDVVYAEGWNAACEKFGNPVFEPTPALVIEVTKEVATPAQTKRLDSDESRLTPPPRLTGDRS